MAKFTKSEVKKSLKQGISLLTKDEDWSTMVWAFFDELPELYGRGFELVNEDTL